jgi:hypothetical protein
MPPSLRLPVPLAKAEVIMDRPIINGYRYRQMPKSIAQYREFCFWENNQKVRPYVCTINIADMDS